MAWLMAADGADGGASTLEAAVLLAKVKCAEINTRIRRDQQKPCGRLEAAVLIAKVALTYFE